MDEAEDCAKQALRTGPVRKEQTSRMHSKRALVNFSTKHKTREQDITHGITDTSDGSRKATSHDKQSRQDTSI